MDKFNDIKMFILSKKHLVLIGLIIFIVGVSMYFLLFKKTDKNNEIIEEDIVITDENNDTKTNDLKKECTVTVDIKGEVVLPGLYEVECDKRIQDVIELAGGVKDTADTSILNLSKKVFDEMVIIIYSKKEVGNYNEVKQEEIKKEENCKNNQEIKNDACIESKNKTTSTVTITEDRVKEETNSSNKTELQPNSININTASQSELTKLPGIGDSKALKIINYRTEVGLFKTIEELKNVKGIGNSIFEKIKSYITV